MNSRRRILHLATVRTPIARKLARAGWVVRELLHTPGATNSVPDRACAQNRPLGPLTLRGTGVPAATWQNLLNKPPLPNVMRQRHGPVADMS